MLVGGSRKPLVELALLDLRNPVTAHADEVMVVALPAEPVARLAWVVSELVDDAVLAEERERPVDGRQTDPLATLP